MSVTRTRQMAVTSEEDGITITWPDGSSRFFHYVWLRSCCYCDTCGHGYDGTFTIQPFEIPLTIRPEELQCLDNTISITWSGDGHQSQYNVSWLLKNAYAKEDRERRRHRPTLWNSDIEKNIPAVDYRAVLEDDEHCMTFLRHLRDFGFAIVRGGPNNVGSGEAMAALIGEVAESTYGKIFDLNPISNNVSFGNTMNAVPPHTDEAYQHTPPGINVLHCLRPADADGDSVLVDGFYLADQLRQHNPEHFEVLTTIPLSYHRIVPDLGIYHQLCDSVIRLDTNGDVTGFRYHTRSAAPLDVPAEDLMRVHAANMELSRMMSDESNQACYKLQAGEAVFFDNHRVMHARKAFNDPHRHMQILCVPRGSFHLKLRMTAHKLGHPDEADQLLSSGVG